MPLELYVAQLGFTEASDRLDIFSLGGCVGHVLAVRAGCWKARI